MSQNMWHVKNDNSASKEGVSNIQHVGQNWAATVFNLPHLMNIKVTKKCMKDNLEIINKMLYIIIH